MLNNKRHLRPTIISIRDVIRFYADKQKQQGNTVRCLQVGANDGITKDPVYPYVTDYQWQSILVEPQTGVFENELKKTYQGVNNAFLENVAIVNSAETEYLELYVLSFSNQRWATGLATFDRKTLEKHIEEGYVDKIAHKHQATLPDKKEDYIGTVRVLTSSIQQLLDKHNFDRLDAFFSDTEGYDFEILRNLDWEKYQPQLVLFESRHLSDQDFLDAQQFLRDKGYKVYWERGDTLGIKFHYPFIRTVISSITAFLRKL